MAADKEDKRLTCPVPWCQAAICSAPARRMIAARDEVPPGCANVISTLGSESPRLHDIRDAEWTPAARQVLALGGSGDCRTMLAKIAEGRLVFLEPRTPRPLRSTPPIRRRPEPEPAIPPLRPTEKTAWIRFRVVDDASSRPLPGVVLSVTEPNGKTFEFTTRPDGMIDIQEIDPGTCSVACGLEEARLTDTYGFVAIGDRPSTTPRQDDEADQADSERNGSVQPIEGDEVIAPPPSIRGVRIATIETHKVRTGESIKSLAEANGLTWQQLAIFNWNTDVPDEINVHLRDDVGCTERAHDGVNFRFDDRDDPGIVYIPTPWSVKGLATERLYTLRVRSLRGNATGINYIRLCVFDDAEQPAPDLAYAIRDVDGAAVCDGKTDALGRIRFDNVQLRDFELVVAGHVRTIPSVAYEDEWIDVFLPWLGYIRLIVRDDHKQPVGALAYAITDANGRAVDSGSTDAEGRIRVERTPLSDYVLVIGEFERTIPAVGYDDEWVDVFLPAEEANHGR
ncbi:MAG: hypothetical protein AMXMBFR47_39390 [Planctomycetota bacterium]